jgi:hypothetical protein
VISGLGELRSVTLRSITLPDLSLLAVLPKLRALDLKLGGTKNLALLPELQGLEYLELWMVKGLSDLAPIRNASSLRQLAVVDMAHLQPEAFAPIAGHRKLESLRAGLAANARTTRSSR